MISTTKMPITLIFKTFFLNKIFGIGFNVQEGKKFKKYQKIQTHSCSAINRCKNTCVGSSRLFRINKMCKWKMNKWKNEKKKYLENIEKKLCLSSWELKKCGTMVQLNK